MPALAAAYGMGERGSASPRGGTDGDDAALATFLHARQEAFQGQERGEQVGVHRRAPPVFRYFLKRGGRGEAATRVGDQDADRSQGFLDLAAHGFDLAEVGDIAGHRDRLSTVAGDGRRDLIRRDAVAPVHGDGRTAPRELGGDGCPDAPRASGDQRHLPVERAHACSCDERAMISMRWPSGSRK